jgi:hypothetical protein
MEYAISHGTVSSSVNTDLRNAVISANIVKEMVKKRGAAPGTSYKEFVIRVGY